MKKPIMALSAALLLGGSAAAQQVAFEEFDLANGLHVILHNDPSTPTVVTSVMYHVGSKDENPERTGFAHFFEHLLFEGTKNIARGEWSKIVTANGGVNNANTSDDRTYYYEVFPSNNLELGLWMESERLMHPVINQIGVDTQKEVIKEEKRTRYDNSPYGSLFSVVKKNLFVNHPYRWTTIGTMEHLNTAKLEDFKEFNEKFYVPNNAVLVVAGDLINIPQTKQWIEKYFGPIKKGAPVMRTKFTEQPITQTIKDTYEDPNIQIPMLIMAYRTPAMTSRDARILDMISTYLSNGKSSKLYKKLVDDKKMALEVSSFNISQEDYSIYIFYALPLGQTTTAQLMSEMDSEITALQQNLISEKDLEKIQNKFENQYVNSNSSVDGVAGNLAKYYLLYGDVNLINTEIDIYQSITREEIREAAKKYLNKNQRLELDYVPAKDKAQN